MIKKYPYHKVFSNMVNKIEELQDELEERYPSEQYEQLKHFLDDCWYAVSLLDSLYWSLTYNLNLADHKIENLEKKPNKDEIDMKCLIAYKYGQDLMKHFYYHFSEDSRFKDLKMTYKEED